MTEDLRLAQQFNGCTSNCGSVCDYIVDLSDSEFEATIAALHFIGAAHAAASLEASRADRLQAQVALNSLKAGDDRAYSVVRKQIDSRDFEREDWSGWCGRR